MAERNPPSWLQGGSHPADLDRMLTSTLASIAGVIEAGHLAVTEDDTVGMRVKVAEGRALIAGTRAPTQGYYHVVSDGPRVIDVPAADATNPRIDLVVARVRDASYDALLDDDWLITLVPGTPAPSPAVPAAPEDSLPLAQVSVGAGATEVTNANLADVRTSARLRAQLLHGVDLAGWVATQPGHLMTKGQVEDYVEGYAVGRWELIDEANTASWVDLNVPSADVGKYHEYLLRVTNAQGTGYPTWVGMRLNGQAAGSDNMRWSHEEIRDGDFVTGGSQNGNSDGAGVIGVTGSLSSSMIECRMHPAWDKPGNAGIVWVAESFRNATTPARGFAHGRWATSEALTQVRIGRVSLPNPSTVTDFEGTVRYELFGLRGAQ